MSYNTQEMSEIRVSSKNWSDRSYRDTLLKIEKYIVLVKKLILFYS